MGKVNVNETKATKTAKKDGDDKMREKSPSSREVAVRSEVEKNVGVKMGTKQAGGNKPNNKSSSQRSNSQKVESSSQRNDAQKTMRVNDNRRKQLALPAGSVNGSNKPKKNIAVHTPELDEGMALMASRAAAAEYEKPDITKMRQQRKSMSGMLVDVARPMNNAGAIDRAEAAKSGMADGRSAEKTDAAKDLEKEKFSKTWSTLIGVGVALVVAVVGFAAIAIFGNNKEKCTVTFESNGGSKVEATEIVCGRTVGQPSDPTKDGFEFEGWIYEGDPFDFSNGIYKNAILVAKWKADEDTEIVTVKFDSDGGSTVAPVEAAKGKTIKEPVDPKKTNWAFAGWYLDGKEFDFSTPITEDITLTANWKWSPATTTTNNNKPSNNNNSNNKPNVDDQNTGNNGNDNPPVTGGDEEEKPVTATGLSVGDVTVNEGESASTRVTVTPTEAEYSLTVAVTDGNVATCSVSGRTVTCSGVNAGSTSVAVTDTKSGKTATFTVTVVHVHKYDEATDKCPVDGALKPGHEHVHDETTGLCKCGDKKEPVTPPTTDPGTGTGTDPAR